MKISTLRPTTYGSNRVKFWFVCVLLWDHNKKVLPRGPEVWVKPGQILVCLYRPFIGRQCSFIDSRTSVKSPRSAWPPQIPPFQPNATWHSNVSLTDEYGT